MSRSICEDSVDLVGRLADGEVDLALATQGSGESGGIVVHREPLVWVTSARHRAHEQDPLPLAVFQQGCCFRRHATERDGADSAGQVPHRLHLAQRRRHLRGTGGRPRLQRPAAQQSSARACAC